MKIHTNKFVATAIFAATLFGVSASPAEASTLSGKAFCPVAQKSVQDFSSKLGIAAPVVRNSGDSSTYYLRTKWTIMLAAEDCGKLSVLAHEYGHYVVDAASEGELDEFLSLSAKFTTGTNWLRTSKDKGGWERAAHCVGYALSGYGAYTKCPHQNLQTASAAILDQVRHTVLP